MGSFQSPKLNKNLCLETMQGKSHLNQKLHELEYMKHSTTLAHYSDASDSAPLFPKSLDCGDFQIITDF